MNETTMPVLIGCGQLTDKRPAEEAGTVIELMMEVARKGIFNPGWNSFLR